MAAIDFTTVEVWTKSGLVTFYLLFVMEMKTRRVHFAGCTTSPNEDWMKQAARELTNCEDGFLNDKQHLIMDRDTKFCESFRSFLSNEGVKPVRLPPRAPNLNAHLERFFGSLKTECLHRLILFGETATRKAVNQFLNHYNLASDCSSSDSPGNSRVCWSGLRDMPLFRRCLMSSTTRLALAVVKSSR